ncbi:MAG: MFS transporter [Candidatus Hadarchaeia archaeon]
MLESFENRKIWTSAVFLYIALWGVSIQMRGALLSEIKATFSVSESLLGLVAPAASVSFALSALLSGMFAGKIFIERYILIGLGLTALATFLLGLAPTYLLFLILLIVVGLFSGIPGGLGRPFVGHLYPESRGRIFSLNEAFWAIGATIGPLFAILIMEVWGLWRHAYIFLGLFFFLVFILMYRADPSEVSVREDPVSFDKVGEILKNPVILCVLFGILFDVGVEGGVFTWLVYYLEQEGFSQFVARSSLSGFLAAYIPGRLLNSRISERFKHENLVAVYAGSVVLLLFSAFFLLSGYWVILAVFVSGFFISGIWPNLFTLGVETFPNYSGPINGLAMTFDPLGFSLIPPIMGFLADKFYIDLAMRFLLVPMSLVFLISLFIKVKI